MFYQAHSNSYFPHMHATYAYFPRQCFSLDICVLSMLYLLIVVNMVLLVFVMSNENFEHFGKLSSQLDFIWQLSDYIRRYLNIVEIAERYSGGSENKNRLYF